jgi:diguanylate cyclase (GGDEF)-like protein
LTILGIALQNRQLSESENSGRLWKTAAEHDPLTGLMNRRAFLPRLQNEQQRTLRNGSVYTFAMLDLDHFKLINDTYGHHSGDGVLRLFATIMQESCRSIDMVVRMGGEEFGILFPECDEAAALIALERIRRRLEDEPLMVEGNAIRITVSVGVAAFNGGQDADVIDRADKALYRAKDSGRNRIIIAAA